MKEYPILMCGDMVRATLADLKTNTRRTKGLEVVNKEPNDWDLIEPEYKDGIWIYRFRSISRDYIANIRCPYGDESDRLWVRETYGIIDKNSQLVGFPLFEYTKADTNSPDGYDQLAAYENNKIRLEEGYKLVYRADRAGYARSGQGKYAGKWRPSIFTPRWASRILLERTETRLERVQDIDTAGCYQEGLQGAYIVVAFMALWDRLNEKRGYGWEEKNPWVWVIGFKRLK